MNRLELTVRGDGVRQLPGAFGDVPADRREDYSTEDLVVVVTEHSFSLERAQVQVTTIMEMVDETTCDVTIVAGGGGYGAFSGDQGRAAEQVRKTRVRIQRFCEQADLSVERHPTA